METEHNSLFLNYGHCMVTSFWCHVCEERYHREEKTDKYHLSQMIKTSINW